MTAEDAPGWPRDVVVIALSEKWFVLGTPTIIAFYTPSGTQCETVILEQPNLVQPLVRMKLLSKLHDLGFPTHHGSGGQVLPGHDSDDLIRRFVEADHANGVQVGDS